MWLSSLQKLIRPTSPAITGPVLQATLLIDNSTSIGHFRNQAPICRGQSECLNLFGKAAIPVFVRTALLNPISPRDPFPNKYVSPKEALRLNNNNYRLYRGTPLYDRTLKILSEVEEGLVPLPQPYDGADIFKITCILTDGADSSSTRRSEDVRHVVDRIIASGRHIVAGIAVDNGVTKFDKIFGRMGIPKQWRLIVGQGEDAIVDGMTRIGTVSQIIESPRSFVEASQIGFAVETVMSGARTIGNMMGAVTQHTPAELGQIPADQLTWRPRTQGYELNPHSGQWEPIKTPLKFNEANGFYELSQPPENTIYFIGRDTQDMNSEDHFKAFVGSANGKHIVFIPLEDKSIKKPGDQSRLSRFHVLLENIGGAVTLRAIDADVSVIDPKDSSKKYLQADGNVDNAVTFLNGEPPFINPQERLWLAPNVVIKMTDASRQPI